MTAYVTAEDRQHAHALMPMCVSAREVTLVSGGGEVDLTISVDELTRLLALCAEEKARNDAEDEEERRNLEVTLAARSRNPKVTLVAR